MRFFAVVITIFLVACGKSPLAPSSSNSEYSRLTSQVVSAWSPYILIHCDDSGVPGYITAMDELQSKGALKGIRAGADSRGRCNRTVDAASSRGIEVLGLISNEDYMVSDWMTRLDIIFNSYRGRVAVFQIGNEVTNGPGVNPTVLDIDQYMVRFNEIYNYVSEKYPEIVLMSQSTISVANAVVDMEKMISGGLAKTDPSRVIVGMNIYSSKNALDYSQYLSKLRNHRIWITESGINDPQEHVRFVVEEYPQIRNILRPERIYWYALWVGDEGRDSGFGLITNSRTPDINRRELYKILAGME